MTPKETLQLAQDQYPYALETRRWFHTHAELSNQEFETTAYIIRELERMGIPYLTPAKTGVIAVIRGGQPGKVLGIRGDIDALPIQEKNEVSYRSKNDGVMHACGHDAHGAALLGTAEILNAHKDQLRGTVKLIFQPAEEYFPSGALAMLEKGDLDDCDAIIGVHVMSPIPSGKICVDPGPKMAASASVNIRVKGKGGHGGMPHGAVDATVAAAAVVLNLQSLASRELDVNHPAILSIGTFHSGVAKNVISEEAYLEGTIRYFDRDQLGALESAIRRIAEHTAEAYRAAAEVEIVPGLPPVVNDADLAGLARTVSEELWQSGAILSTPQSGGVDDFAYYADKAPTLYAQIGSQSGDPRTAYPHHNPRFDLDEECLAQTMAFFTGFAFAFLD